MGRDPLNDFWEYVKLEAANPLRVLQLIGIFYVSYIVCTIVMFLLDK